MSYIDDKYINLISPRLSLFTRKKAGLYNFRCPYCGDSKKRKNKARGYFFKIKADYVYKCHNCGVGRTLSNFLKDQDILLHDQYVMEKFKDSTSSTGKGSYTPNPKLNFSPPNFVKSATGLEKISDLNIFHEARKYLEQRGIKDLDYFYYCPKFKEWTNQHKKTFNNVQYDEPRVIIPLKDKDGVFGYQGRAIGQSSLRYITVMLDENKPKIYGLDKINEKKPVYIVEGPIDSLFLDNSVAMCGSDLDPRSFGWSDYIWVFDNEPRNREIVNRISKTIDRGDKVVIWQKHVEEKDINDMTLSGHNVQSLVESITYQNLEATLKLKDWKKV